MQPKGAKYELYKKLVSKVKPDPSGNSSGDNSNSQQNSTPVGGQAESVGTPDKPGKGGKDAGVQVNPENGIGNDGDHVGLESVGSDESNGT